MKTVYYSPKDLRVPKALKGHGREPVGFLFYLLYLLGVAVTEVVTYHVNETTGVVFYFVMLFGLIISSSLASREEHQKLFLALGLVPLIRIVSLVVPVGEISEIYWYLIIAVIVLVGIVSIMMTLSFTTEEVGLTAGQLPLQAIVALTGLVIGLIDYLILKPDSLITSLTFDRVLLPSIILLISAGFVEELAFRGVIQSAAQAVEEWGWIYVAVLYAVLQIGYGSVMHSVLALAVMLYYGWIVKRTGSILGVSISHGLLAIGLYLVFPHLL